MFYFIVNPASKSGKGIKIWEELEVYLKSEQIPYQVAFSGGCGEIKKIAQELTADATRENRKKIILLGGDGTINEFLQGVSDFDAIEVGYLPAGSSNDLARNLKINPDSLAHLKQVLSCTEPTDMDLGLVEWNGNKTYFAGSSGIGFDAAVCADANFSTSKKKMNKLGLGKLIYVLTALKMIITAPKCSCSITLADGSVHTYHSFLFIASMNHRYEGGGLMLAPKGDYQDGMLDVCAVADISKAKVPVILPTAYKGNHFKYKEVHGFRTERVKIETQIPLWFHVDGETPGKGNCFEISLLPKALHFLY